MKKPQGDIETLTDMVDFCAMFHANWVPIFKSEGGNAVENITRQKVFPIYSYGLLEACVEFSSWDEKFSRDYETAGHPAAVFLIDVMRLHGVTVTQLYQNFHPDEIMALTYFRHSLVHVNISAHRSIPLQVFTPDRYFIEQSKTKSAAESMEKIGKAVESHGGLFKFHQTIFERFCSLKSAFWPLVGEIMNLNYLRPIIHSALANDLAYVPTENQVWLSRALGLIGSNLNSPPFSLREAPYFRKILDGDREL